MIRLCELNPKGHKLTPTTWFNLLLHLHVMNEVRYHYNKPMLCTSGVRIWDEQVALYKSINADRSAAGLPALLPPKKSSHLTGQGSDWKDPKGELYNFLKANPSLMEELDIYVELRAYTPEHTHIQTKPTESGDRFYKPY